MFVRPHPPPRGLSRDRRVLVRLLPRLHLRLLLGKRRVVAVARRLEARGRVAAVEEVAGRRRRRSLLLLLLLEQLLLLPRRRPAIELPPLLGLPRLRRIVVLQVRRRVAVGDQLRLLLLPRERRRMLLPKPPPPRRVDVRVGGWIVHAR